MFWKFDFMTQHLPPFLQPRIHRTDMHMMNMDTLSVIDGEACTGDMGRGGRRNMFVMDEYASWEPSLQLKARESVSSNSSCTIYNSTPDGANNQHFEIAHDKTTRKITLHWSRHPRKGEGLYSVDEKKTTTRIDEDYTYPVNMEFINKRTMAPKPYTFLRSPWYDQKCESVGNIATIVGSQFDISYEGSASQYFEDEILFTHREKYVRDPVMVGDPDFDQYDLDKFKLVPRRGGKLIFWFDPGPSFLPPKDHIFAMGIDTAAGTGASNSVITVWDCTTREKIVEYADPHMKSHRLAKLAVAMGKWFSGGKSNTPAFMLWERNGEGRNFGDAVMEEGYPNVYFMRDEKKVTKKTSQVPGWHKQGAEGCKDLFGKYKMELQEDTIIDRSHECLKECASYVYMLDGTIVHAASVDGLSDPSGARENHGDRVVASALGLKAMREITVDRKQDPPVYLPNTLGARRQAVIAEEKASDKDPMNW